MAVKKNLDTKSTKSVNHTLENPSKVTFEYLKSHLWSAADILRGSLNAGEYRQPIMTILFLKRLNDTFEENAEKLEKKGKSHKEAWENKYRHTFFVPKEARWSILSSTAENIGEKIDHVCRLIERENPDLEGVLTNTRYNDKRKYPDDKLRALISHFNYPRLRNEDLEREDIFGEQDIKDALLPIEKEVNELNVRHKEVMSFFSDIPDRNNNDVIIEKFEPAHVRDNFEYAFKMFSKSLDAVLPRKEAGPYVDDFKYLSKKRQLLRNFYGSYGMSFRLEGQKVQKLVDDYIHALRMENLIDFRKVTNETFLVDILKFKTDRARTALVKNKIRQIIEEKKNENPVYYEKIGNLNNSYRGTSPINN